MYRQLNKEARAPLPLVHRAIRKFERSAPSLMSEFKFNQRIIEILHDHNWRTRDYKAELRSRARQAKRIQYVMRMRSAYAPLMGTTK